MAISFDPAVPGSALEAFMADRHLATLTVLRGDGSPQVTPVGFTYDPDRQLGRVITWAASYKAKAIAARPGSQVAVCHIDGGNWLTFYGTAALSNEPAEVSEAVNRYGARYRPPKVRDDRVVIVIAVDRIVGRLPEQA